MKKVLLAVLGVLVLGAGAMLFVYRQTRYQAAPAAAAGPAAPVLPPDFALPPLPAAPPPAPEARIPIPVGGELQGRLESPDAAERNEAMVEAREQRRAQMMDWLNRNSARRAAAAPAAERR